MNSVIVYSICEAMGNFFPFGFQIDRGSHWWMMYSALISVSSCLWLCHLLHEAKLYFHL